MGLGVGKFIVVFRPRIGVTVSCVSILALDPLRRQRLTYALDNSCIITL